MYLKAVKYKDGSYLAPGSKCFELYQNKQFKELEQLIKELDQKYKKF